MKAYELLRTAIPAILLFAAAPCMAGGFEVSEIMPDDGSVQWTLTGSVRILEDRSCYRLGELECPNYVFIRGDNFSTFALVWLPEDWSEMNPNEREAVVALHQEHDQASRCFTKWQVAALRDNVAVIAPQMWLDHHEVPDGFEPHPEGGYSLDIRRDVYPVICSLADYFNVSEIQVQGSVKRTQTI
ncbi:MAG: hypothetical protein GF388_04230 [Candidatus Aegiribacteria sp.]|nr:hypothetical protein [Candidatus Aegiribacteria sp.]MBD3294447.1 hypothetical protein [Candidatus Fermentibacteria bacterium]